METGIVVGLFLLFFVIATAVIVAKLMVVGNPGEMLIISGKKQADGRGYRVLIGGRTLVIPILEKVSRISLRNMHGHRRSRHRICRRVDYPNRNAASAKRQEEECGNQSVEKSH